MKMDLTVKKSFFRPRYFALQWHITERCNWHCRHCYQKENLTKEELSLQNLLSIFKQYLRLIKHFGTLGPNRTRLVIGGGEPLLNKNLFLFLERIHKYNKYFLLVLLSNGSLITEDNAKKLKSLGVKIFQLSLEGMEKNNDAIRGQGAFQKTIRAIKILVKNKINVTVCLTLTKANLSDISALVRLCEKIGVAQLGIRRLVLMGRAEKLKSYLLEPFNLRSIYFCLEKLKKKLERKKSSLKLVGGCDESIFCQELNHPLINCGVTEGRILAILPNAEVVACRRLPIKVGNVLEKDLLEIYYTSKELRQLRNLNNAFGPCKECLYFDGCLSGAKCISHAYFEKISAPDPQCWKIFKKLPRASFLKNKQDIISGKEKVHFTLLPHLFRQFDKQN